MNMKQSFSELFSVLASHEQDSTLGYPSADAYRDALYNVIRTLVKGKKGIIVYGDYDADGIISAVMLHRFLQNVSVIINGEKGKSFVSIAFSNGENEFGLTKEEFIRFRKENELVITVDNGSSLSFLDASLQGNLLVLDHHPSDKNYSFLINPNVGRRGDDYYSTSGGRITYDFICNLDFALKRFIPRYGEIDNSRQMSVLHELAALTLFSDMAMLDKSNRAFLLNARKTFSEDGEKLPLFTKIEKFDYQEIAFNLTALINAANRTGELPLETVSEWIAPYDWDSWKKADKAVVANNDNKKSIVVDITKSLTKNQREEPTLAELIVLEDQPIRMIGLIANRKAQMNASPVVVISKKKNGDIALSARGRGAKKLVTSLFDQKRVVGKFGGHPDACGGTIYIDDSNTLDKTFSALREHFNKYIDDNRELLERGNKIEVINQGSILPSQVSMLHESFQSLSEGIPVYKDINIAVSSYKLKANHTYKSGWGTLTLEDPKGGGELSLLVDTRITPFSLFDDSKNILIIKLTTSGVPSLQSFLPAEKKGNLKIMDEVIEHNIAIGTTPSPVITSQDKQKELFPATDNARVFFAPTYSEDLLDRYPDKIFVFGDNLIARGKGGQASIRDCDNALGIPTKRLPSMKANAFFSDREDEEETVKKAISLLHKYFTEDEIDIVFPVDGLGTGRAALEKHSPKIFSMMETEIRSLFSKDFHTFHKKETPAIDAPIQKKPSSKANQTGNLFAV